MAVTAPAGPATPRKWMLVRKQQPSGRGWLYALLQMRKRAEVPVPGAARSPGRQSRERRSSGGRGGLSVPEVSTVNEQKSLRDTSARPRCEMGRARCFRRGEAVLPGFRAERGPVC